MSNTKRFDEKNVAPQEDSEIEAATDIVHTNKSKVQRLWPAFACGAGLFSDGYLQSVIGPAIATLKLQYPDEFANSNAASNIGAIAFAGTVVGQLIFGFTSDHWSRKWTLVVSTCILFVFAALGAGSYGANGSINGLISALIAYRFLLGIGIGGEYPAGSVGCAESTGELQEGTRNRWFVLFTNVQIDWGFVVGNLVPMAIAAGAPNNLGLQWRLSLGLGCVFPLSLLYLRIRYREPESVKRNSFRASGKYPYMLGLKYYWPRLLLICGIWFIYDFLTYPFSIFSNTFIKVIEPNQATWQNFGWDAVINSFYLPGAIIGAFISDKMGPRRALYTFVFVQGALGFIMAGCYPWLRESRYVAAFVLIYGLFLSFGEVGPGDNIGLLASKSFNSGFRGTAYAIAAACGKLGGFVGTYVFPYIQSAGGSETSNNYGSYPFYVASCLCMVSALLAFLLPSVNQDAIEKEDRVFREYLAAHGYDISQMGDKAWKEERSASIAQIENGAQREM